MLQTLNSSQGGKGQHFCQPCFQEVLDAYPLWTCGFLNNRIISFSITYSCTLLGLSKVILLFRPMNFHAANHELIVKILLFILGIYFFVDTIVYLWFGNVNYCHTGTILRVAVLYNMDMDEDLIRAQKITKMHNFVDQFFIMILIMSEVIIIVNTSYKKGKNLLTEKRLQISRLRKWVNLKNTRVESIEMGEIQSSTRRLAWDNPNFENNQNSNITNNVIKPITAPQIPQTSNLNLHDRTYSNRLYLLVCGGMNLGFILTRQQIDSDGKYLAQALLFWRVFTRFCRFVLPIIWLLHNINLRTFMLAKIKQWRDHFNL